MSSLQKLIELTKAVTVAVRPVLPNTFSGYTWPIVQVEPHYKSGFSCGVKWDDTHHMPREITDVSAVNKPSSDPLEIGKATGFDTPEDAIDAMYERLLTVTRATLDVMIAANTKLAVLVLHGE